MNVISGGDSSQGVNDGVGLITEDLIKDPETPRADDEAKARSAWSQGLSFNIISTQY